MGGNLIKGKQSVLFISPIWVPSRSASVIQRTAQQSSTLPSEISFTLTLCLCLVASPTQCAGGGKVIMECFGTSRSGRLLVIEGRFLDIFLVIRKIHLSLVVIW